MERRPTSILGLTFKVARTYWGRLGWLSKAAVLASFVAVAAVGGYYARCAISSSCPASGGCPYSQQQQAARSPCSR